jgi:uncharacterized membrane protein
MLSTEERLIGILVVSTLVLGVIGTVAVYLWSNPCLFGDSVESYVATYYTDGKLDEAYTYRLTSSDTRMLFRYWDEPIADLYAVAPPAGSVGYWVNNWGSVELFTYTTVPQDMRVVIGSLANFNEAGCYNAAMFPPGRYSIGYTFQLSPDIEYDGSYYHLNLMLARGHIQYSNVKITIEDASYVSAVYPRPPSFAVSRLGNDIVISGTSRQDEELEVELLMSSLPVTFSGTIIVTDENGALFTNLKGQTESANNLFNLQFFTAVGLNWAATALALLSPFILFFIWYRYGREEDVTVPGYLSTVPNPGRKPWIVSLAFKGGIPNFDENGFYATLLDLHTRNKIRIEPREGGMKIYILDKNVDDPYEQRALEFLASLSTIDATNPEDVKAVFDTDRLSEASARISSASDSQALAAQQMLVDLTKGPVSNPIMGSLKSVLIMLAPIAVFAVFAYFFVMTTMELTPILIIASIILLFLFMSSRTGGLSSNFVGNIWSKMSGEFYVSTSNRTRLLTIAGGAIAVASVVIFLLRPGYLYLTVTPIILGLVVVVESVAPMWFPPTLLGGWRPGVYKERLEWDAFRNHLGELSQLKKYSTEDLSMWGSWLVYGTALGVGDRVTEAMKVLNIHIDMAPVTMTMRSHFHPLIVARPIAVSSGGGKGGGGRKMGGGGGHMGGGGGRGGGGAGRR